MRNALVVWDQPKINAQVVKQVNIFIRISAFRIVKMLVLKQFLMSGLENVNFQESRRVIYCFQHQNILQMK